MRRREFLINLVATAIGTVPSSSSEPIRREHVPLDVPPVVRTYARNVEEVNRDIILRAGSILFYGGDPHKFPAQGALIRDEGNYYVWGIQHAITALELREHKMGVYIPILGHSVEDSRRLSTYLSSSTVNDNIIALKLGENQQQSLTILESARYISPLQLRKEMPSVGEMVAIPHPETANYSYHRITSVNLGFLGLTEEKKYPNPPRCTGQSGAPLLYVDETQDKPKLTNEVVGALSSQKYEYTDEYGRLCSHDWSVAQLHNRFSSKIES